jgi:type II secretory pathway component PulM
MGILIKNELWMRHRERLFFLLVLVIFFLAIFYIYFIHLTVAEIADRKTNLDSLAKLRSEVQGLEVDYISALGKLSIDNAKTLGFVEAEPEAYIYRQKALAQKGI